MYFEKRSLGQVKESLSRRVELLGTKIGHLTVVEEFTPTLKHWKAICECDCGRVVTKWRAGLIEGLYNKSSLSCGECVDDRENLIGIKFNNFRVLSRGIKKDYWLCECVCGNKIEVRRDGIKKSTAYSCGCQPNNNYNGYKNLTGNYWSSMKARARNHKHDFDIKIEEAYNLLERQNFKCTYTGRDISLGSWENGNRDRTVSLDRVNSQLGYSAKNCEWVHKDINIMKWSFSKDFFISMAYLANNPFQDANLNKKNKISKTLFCIWNAGWTRKFTTHDLDIDFLQNLLEKQDYRCAITGHPLFIQSGSRKVSLLTTASVDRINSNLGYIKGNVQFLHKYVNCMKLDFTDDEFRSTCKEISDYCCISKI